MVDNWTLRYDERMAIYSLIKHIEKMVPRVKEDDGRVTKAVRAKLFKARAEYVELLNELTKR